MCVKGGTQAHPSPILSLLEPGDLGEGVAQKGNPGLRRGNPVPRVKESACNARDLDLIPGSGRPPGEGNNSYPLQYSCLGDSMDRGTGQSCKELDTTDLARDI